MEGAQGSGTGSCTRFAFSVILGSLRLSQGGSYFPVAPPSLAVYKREILLTQ